MYTLIEKAASSEPLGEVSDPRETKSFLTRRHLLFFSTHFKQRVFFWMVEQERIEVFDDDIGEEVEEEGSDDTLDVVALISTTR